MSHFFYAFRSALGTAFGSGLKSALGLAALLVAGFTGGAAAQNTNPSTVYQSVTPGVVLSVLAESGFQTTVSQMQGISVITAMRGEATPLILTVVPCGAPEAPNCQAMVMLGVAPISILGGGPVVNQLTTLAGINSYEDFLMVKFIIMDPQFLTAMRSEIYPFGGTRGNIRFALEAMSMTTDMAFRALRNLPGGASGMSGLLPGSDAPGVGVNSFATFGSGVLTESDAKSSDSDATQKTLDLVRTLMRSKTFRQDILPVQ